MALRQAIELPNGFVADYLNIHHLEVNRPQRTVLVRLAIFKDQTARLLGKAPASMAEPIQLAGEQFPGTAETISYAAIYSMLKTLPGFAAAEDC